MSRIESSPGGAADSSQSFQEVEASHMLSVSSQASAHWRVGSLLNVTIVFWECNIPRGRSQVGSCVKSVMLVGHPAISFRRVSLSYRNHVKQWKACTAVKGCVQNVSIMHDYAQDNLPSSYSFEELTALQLLTGLTVVCGNCSGWQKLTLIFILKLEAHRCRHKNPTSPLSP